MNLDYLCVGHVCMDMMQSGFVMGGSAAYCSLYAKTLGYKSGVITSFGDQYEFKGVLSNLDSVTVDHAERSTIFENRYLGEQRTQILHSVAEKISLNRFVSKEECSILHLCPLADEVMLGTNFSTDSFVCMTIQGWLRGRNESKEVVYKEMDFEVLKLADVVILSEEDIPDIDNKLEMLKEYSNILIITNGSQGAKCYQNGTMQFFPASPAKMIDPTGAGDIFATGFCLNYYKSQNLKQAMIAGHCLASLCVEREGLESIPNLYQYKNKVIEYVEDIS